VTGDTKDETRADAALDGGRKKKPHPTEGTSSTAKSEREKGDLSARKGSSEAVTLEGKCPQNRGLWER
jgi:hypothetical protein